MDHQVVAMEFDSDITATFTMTAYTRQTGHKIRIHGTAGEIEFTEHKLIVLTFY